jgi:hypothetical protein
LNIAYQCLECSNTSQDVIIFTELHLVIPSTRSSQAQFMPDLTPLFRTTLTSVTSRATELGLVLPGKEKSRILGGQGHSFTKQAEKMVQRSLADLLQEHRGANMQNHAASSRQMGEAERHQVRRASCL